MHHSMARLGRVPARIARVAAAGIILVITSFQGTVALAARAGFGLNDFGFASEFSSSPDSYRATELIVRFKSAAVASDRSRVAAVVSGHRMRWRRSGYGGAFCVVSVAAGSDLSALCRSLCRDPRVAYVEPNRVLRAAQASTFDTPVSDPFFRYQWNLGDAPGGLNLPGVWTRSTGTGVIIAVLDTGIAYEDRGHYRKLPDFEGTSFVPGYDFVNDDPFANDDRGHGTHVAAVIAQSTNNGAGCAGIAPGATLMPIKVLDRQGIGADDWIASGIRFAVDHGARVLNLSLGGPGESRTIQEAIEYAVSRGALILVAAGNQGGFGIDYPASAPQCVAVGATRYDATRCFYSNMGPELDLMAPGGDLTRDQNGDGYPDGILQQTLVEQTPGRFRYRWEMGTSFSVAHVTGIAALVWAAHPDWNAEQVRRALIRTARDLGPSGFDAAHGFGLVDAERAVAADLSLVSDEASALPALDQRAADAVTHDVRVDGVQALTTSPIGQTSPIVVAVTNAGTVAESVGVSLTDATTGLTLPMQTLALEPGAAGEAAFETHPTAPLGRHRWIARVTPIGPADGRPEDNERTVEVTVVKGPMELVLQAAKPIYRRGERVILALGANGLGGGDTRLPLAGVPVRIVVFYGTSTAPLFTSVTWTDAQGRASISLPLILGRTGVGTFRAQATAAPELYQAATATTTFVVNR